jgi:hypothetical protein
MKRVGGTLHDIDQGGSCQGVKNHLTSAFSVGNFA